MFEKQMNKKHFLLHGAVPSRTVQLTQRSRLSPQKTKHRQVRGAMLCLCLCVCVTTVSIYLDQFNLPSSVPWVIKVSFKFQERLIPEVKNIDYSKISHSIGYNDD